MPITEFLERNAREFGSETALVEINPSVRATGLTTWKEYELMQSTGEGPYRQEITWEVFNEKANRVANFLLARGVRKGDKVAILLMNCLDWLPVYFGILKSGALAVPMNFRYSSDEIEYCLNLSDSEVLIFGPEFIGRIEEVAESISRGRLLLFDGPACPTFAEDFTAQVANYPSHAPGVEITDDDYAAIYFSSGTTGFPKAILHKHAGLMHSAIAEQKHHGQQHDDTFLCIPPLYHTGAKMHWFGSLVSGSKAVLLLGTKPDDSEDRQRRALHDRVAPRPVGAGYPECAGFRRAEARGLRDFSVAPDAHRRAARASVTGPSLARILPGPAL